MGQVIPFQPRDGATDIIRLHIVNICLGLGLTLKQADDVADKYLSVAHGLLFRTLEFSLPAEAQLSQKQKDLLSSTLKGVFLDQAWIAGHLIIGLLARQELER